MATTPKKSTRAGMPPPDEPELTYEQARAQLAEVVAALESGGAPLAESVELWRRGEKLAQICQRWLDGAKGELDAAGSADGGGGAHTGATGG